MKTSAEILGLPVISITEGRELGMSKTLLIDAPNRVVAAITIEDEDWYRGVKLIPYDNVIAVGEDAVTINNSENILTLDAAGDFETLLDDNIRVIGTKATIQSEAYLRALAAVPGLTVSQQACPAFVEFVEAGVTTGEEIESVAREYLTPLKDAAIPFR